MSAYKLFVKLPELVCLVFLFFVNDFLVNISNRNYFLYIFQKISHCVIFWSFGHYRCEKVKLHILGLWSCWLVQYWLGISVFLATLWIRFMTPSKREELKNKGFLFKIFSFSFLRFVFVYFFSSRIFLLYYCLLIMVLWFYGIYPETSIV